MTWPCWACDGSGESVFSHGNDPQNDRHVPCKPCKGTGNELCCWCDRPATVRAWAKETRTGTAAHLLYYCAEHLAQDQAQGMIVAVVP
jgi:hypothetical protein